MMNEEVIVQVVPIPRIGERVYFQIPLPNDARKIIGIEYGTLKKEGEPIMSPRREAEEGSSSDPYFQVTPNKTIGSLILQSPGSENIFFQGNLVENRNQALNEGISAISFQPFDWTHCGKREEISFSVANNTRFIEGFFQDFFGTEEYETLGYNLHLYLWIEKCNT